MNRYIIMAATAAILLAGCTKNETVLSTDSSQEITFSAYNGRTATKADPTALQTGSFQVTADYTKDATTSMYFSNETFSWNGTDKFTSTTPHYWPVEGTLTFYATMPAAYASSPSTAITPASTVDFTADGTTDFQAAYQADKTSSTVLPLAFNHKLTKVSFTAVGQNTALTYKISSVVVNALSEATYTMSSAGSWGTAATAKDYTVVNNAESPISITGTTATALGSALYLLPSAETVSLTVAYKVYDGDNLVDDHSTGVTVDLSTSAADWDINESFKYNLTLGVNSAVSPITFNAEQDAWGDDTGAAVDVKIPVTSITLSSSSVNLAPNGTTTLTATVAPANATNKTVTWSSSNTAVATVVASTGVVTGQALGTATITATAADGSGETATCTVKVSYLLPGKFTVNSSSTQVQFTRGNLYWDGSAFKFESSQTAYPSSWSTDHVGHFFWTNLTDYQSGTASYMPYASTYSYSSLSASDKFWCGEDNKLIVDDQGGLYALSSDEWTYLLNTRTDNRFAKAMVNNVKGLIIFPDGYTGTTSGDGIAAVNTSGAAYPTSSIATETWSSMEFAGCVFLPAAGRRSGSNVTSAGSDGYYWSSTSASYEGSAYHLGFYDSSFDPSLLNYRSYGYSVRLVSVSN